MDDPKQDRPSGFSDSDRIELERQAESGKHWRWLWASVRAWLAWIAAIAAVYYFGKAIVLDIMSALK